MRDTINRDPNSWFHPDEAWTAICGHEDYYIVSNMGRVISLRSNKLVTPSTADRYAIVNFYVKGKRTSISVHRLVAMHFVSNPENKPQVNHKDGDRLNNRAESLEWCTASENIHHAVKAGLSASGCRSVKSRLTKEDLKTIKYLSSKGVSQRIIGKLFNVSDFAVYSLLKGKSYKKEQTNE